MDESQCAPMIARPSSDLPSCLRSRLFSRRSRAGRDGVVKDQAELARLADAPPVPPDAAIPFWADQRAWLLAATTAMALALAVAGIFSQLLAVMVLSFCICGLSGYAFVQHQHLKRLEDEKADAQTMRAFAMHMQTRNAELVRKYNALLATGNSRIEQYYAKVDRWRQEIAHLEQDAKALMTQAQSVDQRCAAMAERFINEHCKWIAGRTKPDPESFIRNRDQLIKAFNFVQSIGHPTPKEIEASALRSLKAEYEQKVRDAALKDEQRRIAQRSHSTCHLSYPLSRPRSAMRADVYQLAQVAR